MKRLKVRRDSAEFGFWWVVQTKDWSFYKTFDTHAEALAYADRKARTREYVLPRLTALPTERHIYSRGWIIDRLNPGWAVYLEPDHRVPVALAILAQIEKEKHRYEC